MEIKPFNVLGLESVLIEIVVEHVIIVVAGRRIFRGILNSPNLKVGNCLCISDGAKVLQDRLLCILEAFHELRFIGDDRFRSLNFDLCLQFLFRVASNG